VIIEKRERVSSAETIAFTVLDAAVKKIAVENMVVIMNKCSEDDDIETVLEFYNEARKQAKVEILPELKDGKQVLVVERRAGIKKNLRDEELKAAQFKVMKSIREEVVHFIGTKLAAVKNKCETKVTKLEEI